MSNGEAVTQKTQHKITIWSSNFTYGYISKRESRDSNIWMLVFLATSFTVAKRQKPSSNPRVIDRCMHTQNMVYTHTMDYYSTLKRKETLIHSAKWMNLEDMILGEISKNSQGQILHDSSYVQYMQ